MKEFLLENYAKELTCSSSIATEETFSFVVDYMLREQILEWLQALLL